MPKPRAVLIIACALLAACVSLPASAQTSTKPIQIYVPFAPGGSADGIARIVATELGTSLHRQVVVINQPGAGGTLGLITASKQPGDGDTLAIAATGALAINPHLPNSNAFDTLKELAPVAKLIDIPLVIVTNAQTGPQSVRDAVELAMSRPEGLSYGTTGVNSSQHLAVELLKKVTGANFVHVPYRGSAPAVTDVLGGQIPMASVDLTSAYEQIKAGNLTALGVSSAARARTAPEIPTIAESGFPTFDGTPSFIGLLAPASTPPAKINEISRAVGAAWAKPDVQAKIATLSVEPAYSEAAAFTAMLYRESDKWRDLLKTLPQAK